MLKIHDPHSCLKNDERPIKGKLTSNYLSLLCEATTLVRRGVLSLIAAFCVIRKGQNTNHFCIKSKARAINLLSRSLLFSNHVHARVRTNPA